MLSCELLGDTLPFCKRLICRLARYKSACFCPGENTRNIKGQALPSGFEVFHFVLEDGLDCRTDLNLKDKGTTQNSDFCRPQSSFRRRMKVTIIFPIVEEHFGGGLGERYRNIVENFGTFPGLCPLALLLD